jgi:hypothetical protein
VLGCSPHVKREAFRRKSDLVGNNWVTIAGYRTLSRGDALVDLTAKEFKLLAPVYIQTVRDIGYRFDPAP